MFAAIDKFRTMLESNRQVRNFQDEQEKRNCAVATAKMPKRGAKNINSPRKVSKASSEVPTSPFELVDLLLDMVRTSHFNSLRAFCTEKVKGAGMWFLSHDTLSIFSALM